MIQNMIDMIERIRNPRIVQDKPIERFSIKTISMTIRLSALGIAHIPFNDLPKDFTFHVGRNEHKC
jgi:hypothetical protein